MSCRTVLDEMAKVGYETMFTDSWETLPPESIERTLWLSIAKNMITKLWALYQDPQIVEEIKGKK